MATRSYGDSEIMGVNNRLQLSQAEKVMQQRIIEKHLLSGVTIINPSSTYIEKTVVIERDVTIYPGCILEGETIIGEDCIIGPDTRIRDARLARAVTVQNSVVLESTIDEETSIGPFAYLRQETK